MVTSVAHNDITIHYTMTLQAVEDEREAENEVEDEEDEEYDSGGSGVALTPPESPGKDH